MIKYSHPVTTSKKNRSKNSKFDDSARDKEPLIGKKEYNVESRYQYWKREDYLEEDSRIKLDKYDEILIEDSHIQEQLKNLPREEENIDEEESEADKDEGWRHFDFKKQVERSIEEPSGFESPINTKNLLMGTSKGSGSKGSLNSSKYGFSKKHRGILSKMSKGMSGRKNSYGSSKGSSKNIARGRQKRQ
jgi:hypothetical protein